MVRFIQREVDTFKDNVWSIYRIRDQKGVHLPSCAPNHIYNFPEEYNLCSVVRFEKFCSQCYYYSFAFTYLVKGSPRIRLLILYNEKQGFDK